MDPGFGFGKNLEHNLAFDPVIFSRSRLVRFPYISWSVSEVDDRCYHGENDTEHRLAGSVAAAPCVREGAQIVRVHDVAETMDALKVWDAIYNQ